MTDTHNTKVCSKCGQEKTLDEFYKRQNKSPIVRKRSSDGHAGFCKSCYIKKAKKWATENNDKRKIIAKRYDDKNKEKKKIYTKEYKKTDKYKDNNRLWRKNNVTTYLRNKRQSDPMFALRVKMRSIIRKAFDRNGYTKRSKSQSILCCTFEELKTHLEKKFEHGMSWENRSEWHIDHIIPLSSAKTEEDVIRLNHYTNLQPLWAADNLRKSDKMDYEPCKS